jgi:YggT family protein
MTLLHNLILLYIWVFIVAALLSWFPITNPSGGLAATRRVLGKLTEPVLRPIRAILPRPRVGAVAIDFSVLIAIVALEIINSFIH